MTNKMNYSDAQKQKALALIDVLQEVYPNAFPKKPLGKVPLAIGITEQLISIKEKLGVSANLIRIAMELWCSGVRYKESLKIGSPRYNLDGSYAGIVMDRKGRIELENKLLATEKERDEAIAKAEEYEKEICEIEVKCCACYDRVRNLKAALEKIVKEDENHTTYEENFGTALHIARQALREWKEPKIAHKKAKSPHA